tara:strand:- start:21311 stop:23137 length:1827 start_codon:yes stop_codon:yes gene_type:complete
MCGIAGFFGNRRIDKNNVFKTLTLMQNRGPNFSNYFEKKFGDKLSIYLLHSRLSIIDLKQRSNQPFVIGDHIIIFNGEIYNYIELKKRLIEKGVNLKTNSDTEVLLNYFILYGEKCVDYFDGMWAFAIFNRKTKKLFLSRDPFGEKPLYFYRDKYGIFFGSEIKFIKNLSGEDFEKNSSKINRYLSFGARSLFKDNETFYNNVFSVKNSENLFINSKLKITHKKYWEPITRKKNYKNQDIYEISKNLLYTSLERRLRADVPMAFLLSGGIDSGGLASLAVRIFGKKINTFSIVDKDPKYNEIKNIKKVVSDLGCNNNIIELSKNNFIDQLQEQIQYHDSPVFTLAQFLHCQLMNKIKPTGTKVVISGTGADEIYSGYYDHFLMYLAKIRNNKNYYKELSFWKKFIRNKIRNPVFKNKDLFVQNPEFREHVYDNSKILSKNLIAPEKFNFKEFNYSKDLFTNRRANELFHETVPAILNNEDLNAMKNSIENRSPFLNRELLNFIYSVKSENLIKEGFSKHILRSNLKGILNEKVRTDRQKKGFNCSIETLINLKNKNIQDYLLEKKSKIFDYVDRGKFKNFLRGDFKKNYKNKFIFSFISAKLFLDKKA